MPVAIKICGITSPRDALLAVNADANYLGLIFVDASPRKVTLEQAAKIIAAVSGKIKIVGVFQDTKPKKISQVLEHLALDHIQLHGNEVLDAYLDLPVSIIPKLAWGLSITPSMRRYFDSHWGSKIHALLFEPPKDGNETLETSLVPPDWEETAQHYQPHFLAGRLSPANLSAVLDRYHPRGVDVASGVESRPGVKDPEKLRQFCSIARQWIRNPQNQ